MILTQLGTENEISRAWQVGDRNNVIVTQDGFQNDARVVMNNRR